MEVSSICVMFGSVGNEEMNNQKLKEVKREFRNLRKSHIGIKRRGSEGVSEWVIR